MILVLVIFIIFFCFMIFTYCLTADLSFSLGMGTIGMVITFIIVTIICFSSMNERTTSETYNLGEIEKNKYYTTYSDNISVKIKTNSGFKNKTFRDSIATFKYTKDAPKVKIITNTYKYLKVKDDEIINVVIYIPKGTELTMFSNVKDREVAIIEVQYLTTSLVLEKNSILEMC